MKHTNHVFTAFEKRFNRAGQKWAEWMSKKESTVSNKWKKVCLLAFVVLMISLLWLPLFFKSKPPVVDVGSINPPVSINRSDYQQKIRRMDYLLDSIKISSSKHKDSLEKHENVNTDTLK